MSGNGFDSIAQAMLTQKQKMDELQAENRELRRQIEDIRTGHGIFLEIAGMRFPLKGEIGAPNVSAVNMVRQQEFPASPATAVLAELPDASVNAPEAATETPPPATISETAPTVTTPVQELPATQTIPQEQNEQEKAPTFLEEIMIDEFATASTSPMAVWRGPVNKQQLEPIDEEKKAALRRELMGSFLLE